MRILIIEDEEDLVYALKKGLNKLGYIVDTIDDGREGLELFHINEYDLVVLDLNLPSMDGLEILSKIRENNEECKIIILSARSSFEHRIEGLDMGANDYLVKPFDFGELTARIRSLLRRKFIQQNTRIKYNNIILDTSMRCIFNEENEKINISPKEFAIFEYLMINRGRPIKSEEIIEHIWSEDDNMFSNSVKVHISTLRKKLSQYCEDEIISNVRGAGYIIKNLEEKNDK